MSRKERLALIEKIERKRKSKLLVYVTSDRQGAHQGQIAPDVLPIIAHHLEALLQDGAQQLDLFLYSRGGHSDAPWSIVTLAREFLAGRNFNVLIPFRAHSAATVIAVGSDQIVMTPMAELGPIDATIHGGPHNPRDPNSGSPLPMSVEDVRGYMELLDIFKLDGDDKKMQAFSELAKQVPPLGLGSVGRLLSQTQRVAEQLLCLRKEKLENEKIAKIVDSLSSEISSHTHSIRRSEARQIGIDFVIDAEEENIDEELMLLFSAYSGMLELDSPFDGNGELIKEDVEEKTWEDFKLAIIESTHAKNILNTDFRIVRLRGVPPQVAINLQNLQLAIPPLPDSADPSVLERVQEMIRQAIQIQLDEVVGKATKQLVRSFPEQGFQMIEYNTSWRIDTTEE